MFGGGYWQFCLVSKGEKPSLSEYWEMRQYLGAAHLSTLMVELTSHVHWNEYMYEEPAIHRLTILCRNAVCFANDLFSLGKELQETQNNADFNLVSILRREQSLSLEQAIREAARIHDELVAAFEQESVAVYRYSAKTNRELKKYVQGLEQVMAGNIYWSVLDTSRYPHIYEDRDKLASQPWSLTCHSSAV